MYGLLQLTMLTRSFEITTATSWVETISSSDRTTRKQLCINRGVFVSNSGLVPQDRSISLTAYVELNEVHTQFI